VIGWRLEGGPSTLQLQGCSTSPRSPQPTHATHTHTAAPPDGPPHLVKGQVGLAPVKKVGPDAPADQLEQLREEPHHHQRRPAGHEEAHARGGGGHLAAAEEIALDQHQAGIGVGWGVDGRGGSRLDSGDTDRAPRRLKAVAGGWRRAPKLRSLHDKAGCYRPHLMMKTMAGIRGARKSSMVSVGEGAMRVAGGWKVWQLCGLWQLGKPVVHASCCYPCALTHSACAQKRLSAVGGGGQALVLGWEGEGQRTSVTCHLKSNSSSPFTCVPH